MMKNRVFQYFGLAIIVSIVIALFIHLMPLLQHMAPRGDRGPRSDRHLVLNMVVTALVSFCTFAINYYFLKPLHSTRKPKAKDAVIVVLITLLSVSILSDVFYALLHGGNRLRFFRFDFVYTIRDLVISIVVLGGIFFIKALTDRQAFLFENEQLTRENLQRKFDSLKNQLSPHFLFNSLSALKSLISESPENARQYVDHLSQVLRFSLSGQQTRTTSLKEELELVQSYLYLVQMRYESNLTVDIVINAAYHSLRLPPLSLQTLIENAIKHNVISKKHPLTIKVRIEDEKLVVTNTLREKYSEEPGTGIGLANLSNQYKLLGEGDITILKNEAEFRVELPLLRETI